MKIFDYYKKPERCMVGMLIAYLLVVIFVLAVLKTFVVSTGAVLSDLFCHALWLCGGPGFLILVLTMLLYPLRFFIPIREKSLSESFEAGFVALFLLLFVIIGMVAVFGDVIGMIDEGEARYRNGGNEYESFASVDEMEPTELNPFLVPTGATDIRRCRKFRFRGQSYSVRCQVDANAFRDFARQFDYRFSSDGCGYFSTDDCIMRELKTRLQSFDRILFCRAKWDRGDLFFVYDETEQVFYAHYDD